MHDLEVMGSYAGQVKLGVDGISVKVAHEPKIKSHEFLQSFSQTFFFSD